MDRLSAWRTNGGFREAELPPEPGDGQPVRIGPLPPSLAFLLRHGHSPEPLHAALALARAIGVHPADAAIRHGFIEEEAYHRALAIELGCLFLPEPCVGRLSDFPASILHGIAPLADDSANLVRAPAGPAIDRLLETREPAHNMALTTPSAMRRAVLQARARTIAAKAATDLCERDARLSYRDQYEIGQLVLVSAATGFICAGAVAAWEATANFLAIVLGPLFLGMVMLRLAAMVDNPPVQALRPPPRLPDASLPDYTVIVALHREGRVVEQLVNALSRLDYPAARLDVKLVIETGDRETAEALARITLPPFVEVITAPPGEPRTKPRALNVALPLARGTFTVIYDADDLPDPRQLRWAAALFAMADPRLACLQGRLRIYNAGRNWLTRLFALDYAALFDVINPGLLAAGLPIPLGGTSNHFRTAVLREVYGWDPWNVTEDTDLGIRLARMGYRTDDLPSFTAEEAPASFRFWLRQRTRWMKGFMQTCITHSRQPLRTLRQLGFASAFALFSMTFGTVLSALGYPLFLGLVVAGLWDGSLLRPEGLLQILSATASLVLLGSGFAAILLPGLVAVHRRSLWPLLPYVPLLPFYYALVSLAAWRGLCELVIDPFRWNKTDHRPAVRSTRPEPKGRGR